MYGNDSGFIFKMVSVKIYLSLMKMSCARGETLPLVKSTGIYLQVKEIKYLQWKKDTSAKSFSSVIRWAIVST